ncbi:HlyD family type I secretion periplasmic adaptor subunit, partial [Snodgrassella sp. CFCC 13594]|uniref:HlyD family type I secretion periplasmic adaptor subunit n=1 Tax=Snodgrassella sp. CFCC 13594 TaxID=1775559 RepID=UPI00082E56A0
MRNKYGYSSTSIQRFFQRYATVWKNVWSIREQLDPPKRDEDERAFLPAHLELTETPLSAAPKWIARLIMLFALIALAWALLGKMDIVAVAPGKTTPGGRSKVIQPLETSVVDKIDVANGSHVKAGQVLVELSGIGSDSDYTQSEQALQAARLTKLRLEAVMQSIENKKSPRLDPAQAQPWHLDPALLSEAQTLAQNQFQTWYTQDAQLQTVLRGHQAELQATRAQVNKLEQTSAIERKRTADYKDLLAQNFVSKHAYYEQESKLIQNQNDLASQRSQMQQIQESIREAQQNRLLNTETLKRDTLDQLRQANEQIQQLTEQTDKALQRKQLMTLKSPVTGTIQQLATHTIGGVVTAAQPIMVVVPDEDQMEIEAMVQNKDIGFVKAGQDVVIKIESFPYTRYGYLTGKVKSVSFDAIEDEKMGLVFAAIIQLDRNHLTIDGQK